MTAAQTGVVVRRGGAQDLRFLRDMLHHAYYWKERAPEDTGPGPVALYVKAWGRPGDAAMIAIDSGFPVGAAWYRLFTEDEPGYGFVDEETPELSIAVVPSKRARGYGGRMLGALMDRARDDGFARLSLSVEPDNPSIALYEKFGFRKVGERNGTTTMVADLKN